MSNSKNPLREDSNNMSIGELADWLKALPMSVQHLPVKIGRGDTSTEINEYRLFLTDGNRYFSIVSLKGMKLFPGVYLEIDAE